MNRIGLTSLLVVMSATCPVNALAQSVCSSDVIRKAQESFERERFSEMRSWLVPCVPFQAMDSLRRDAEAVVYPQMSTDRRLRPQISFPWDIRNNRLNQDEQIVTATAANIVKMGVETDLAVSALKMMAISAYKNGDLDTAAVWVKVLVTKIDPRFEASSNDPLHIRELIDRHRPKTKPFYERTVVLMTLPIIATAAVLALGGEFDAKPATVTLPEPPLPR